MTWLRRGLAILVVLTVVELSLFGFAYARTATAISPENFLENVRMAHTIAGVTLAVSAVGIVVAAGMMALVTWLWRAS